MPLLFLSQLLQQFYVEAVYVETTLKQVSAAFVFVWVCVLSGKNARVEYLLIVFDVILQDNSVGLVRFMPQQSDTVLTGVLLADG